MTTQKWYQSWGLWVSMGALIALIVKDIWGIDISERVDKYMEVLLSILIGFGIVNNPNTRGALGYNALPKIKEVEGDDK